MCSDPETVWYPQREVCFATMAKKAAEKRTAVLRDEKNAHWHDLTFKKWGPKRDPANDLIYEAGWGETVYAAAVDIDPDDAFTADVYAQPASLRAPKSESEVDRGRTS